MKRIRLLPTLVCLSMLPIAGSAFAAIPSFNGTCPGGLDVHADEGGPVYVNGRETTLKRFNDNYVEARDEKSGTTVSISRAPDGGLALSYTGRGRANGICTVGAPASGDKAVGHKAAAAANDTLLGACNTRAGQQGAVVTRVPVNDATTELIVDCPDGRYLCMVRNDGLVESLEPLRKR